MYGMWRGRGHGYRRGGFFFPGLLLFGLFILIFGKFLWPLLFLLFFAAPLIFLVKAAHWRHYGGWHGEGWRGEQSPGEKRKWGYGEFDADEKPKRGGDGEWV